MKNTSTVHQNPILSLPDTKYILTVASLSDRETAHEIRTTLYDLNRVKTWEEENKLADKLLALLDRYQPLAN